MDLARKAREYLEAAGGLLPHLGAGAYFSNASASRAYYAAYLATAHCVLRRGFEFSANAGKYFRHDTLPDEVCGLIGGLPVRWATPDVTFGDYDGRERTLEVF